MYWPPTEIHTPCHFSVQVADKHYIKCISLLTRLRYTCTPFITFQHLIYFPDLNLDVNCKIRLAHFCAHFSLLLVPVKSGIISTLRPAHFCARNKLFSDEIPLGFELNLKIKLTSFKYKCNLSAISETIGLIKSIELIIIKLKMAIVFVKAVILKLDLILVSNISALNVSLRLVVIINTNILTLLLSLLKLKLKLKLKPEQPNRIRIALMLKDRSGEITEGLPSVRRYCGSGAGGNGLLVDASLASWISRRGRVNPSLPPSPLVLRRPGRRAYRRTSLGILSHLCTHSSTHLGLVGAWLARVFPLHHE